ncbi:MAG TPA: ATP phosphoribosyltransferase regulatory subunit [Candidatus Limnocylindria bacterium]|nr:ATP phosphoribosyltransferase regulatory subunit [Candidatus Limnocylindria bacterium]
MNGAVPRGFRDILPTEARELHAIERTLMSAFAGYGYVPLEPPTVEFAERAVTVDERRTVRFLDRDGRLLAMRPDVTTAVARVVAQRYREAEATLRLAYFTPIFREEASMRGSEREYDQAGVELIGDATLRADAEVIALLGDALARCGPLAADIDIGHVGYLDGFLAALPADVAAAAGAAARSGDLVGTVSLARAGGMGVDRVGALERGLRHRSADLGAARSGAPRRSQDALDTLDALRPLLEAAGVGGAIRFDLGYIPALPYYTGVVFQVTVAGLGFPIATGGRYDGLLAKFGADRPATGFGIAIPHLHQALVSAGWRTPAESPLLVLLPGGGDGATTLRVARSLRGSGIAVAIGDVAEAAGQDVRRARVVDEGHLEYEGAVRAIEAVIAALAAAPR